MSKIYEKILRPLLFTLPPERAHEIGLRLLRRGLDSPRVRAKVKERFAPPPIGEFERFGITFKNPIGLAAGFDKNGVAVNQLAALGFGFVEVGTVTPLAQEGNSKPRIFRLPKDGALINRLGFNNDGALEVFARLRKIKPDCVLGINIGRNKDEAIHEATAGYLDCFEKAFEIGDYVALNISSPNTPNLREMQKGSNLARLLESIQKRNQELGSGKLKPVLVKIAPDLADNEIKTIVEESVRFEIAGIIATNTTITRTGLLTDETVVKGFGEGGLSGKPIAKLSNEVIKKVYRYSEGKLPIIGIGGIFDAEDAFDKFAAGASLLQAYTGFVYQGPSFVRDITIGLAQLIKEKGFNGLDDAIGSSAK